MVTIRAAKIDRNQPEIVKTLRDLGCKVKPLHIVGDGFPDLLICYRGALALVEVKDGALSPSRKKLTPDEQKFHTEWSDAPLYIVESVAEIDALLASMG